MKLGRGLWTFSILLVLAAGQAKAGKFYVGGSVSQSSVDIGVSSIDDGSITSSNVDNSDKGWKGFAGWKLFKYFAVEADRIDAGEVTIDAMSDGSGFDFVAGEVRATADVDGYRVSALGIVPIGKHLSVFARFGFFDWDANSSVANGGVTTTDSDGDTDAYYGAGVGWKFRGGTSFRVEYETMTLDTTDVDVVSVGFAFGF